jgi:hypothetical protein
MKKLILVIVAAVLTVGSLNAQVHRKKDGSPDMRYKENKWQTSSQPQAGTNPILELDKPKEKEKDDDLTNVEIISNPDRPAEYSGTKEELKEFIYKRLDIPVRVANGQAKGICEIKFVVHETGRISNPIIIKSVPNCSECDSAAIYLVHQFSNWIPAKKANKQVKSYVSLPLKFFWPRQK